MAAYENNKTLNVSEHTQFPGVCVAYRNPVVNDTVVLQIASLHLGDICT